MTTQKTLLTAGLRRRGCSDRGESVGGNYCSVIEGGDANASAAKDERMTVRGNRNWSCSYIDLPRDHCIQGLCLTDMGGGSQDYFNRKEKYTSA